MKRVKASSSPSGKLNINLQIDNFCSGVVRVWQVEKAKEVFVQSNSQITASAEAGGLAVTNLMVNKNVLAMVGVDHTIVFHALENFECQKLVTFNCL